MELFFPLIGVAALGIAAVGAVCCILIPGPKHLVSRVFFGTFAFLFGGTASTFMVFVAFALGANAIALNVHLQETSSIVILGFILLLTGATSAWGSVRLVHALFKSIDARKVD